MTVGGSSGAGAIAPPLEEIDARHGATMSAKQGAIVSSSVWNSAVLFQAAVVTLQTPTALQPPARSPR